MFEKITSCCSLKVKTPNFATGFVFITAGIAFSLFTWLQAIFSVLRLNTLMNHLLLSIWHKKQKTPKQMLWSQI